MMQRYITTSVQQRDSNISTILAMVGDAVWGVGVLERQTYQGGTRGSRLCGEDRDRGTENSKVCARTRDTRFIQILAAKMANPTSCLGGSSMAPCAWCWLRSGCPARYPALLYIVHGAGS
jgi:hypothetical protein